MSKWINADALKQKYTMVTTRYGGGIMERPAVVLEAIDGTPSIDICFCRECEWEWTQKCPPHRMGLVHDESDYCSYGIRREEDENSSR